MSIAAFFHLLIHTDLPELTDLEALHGIYFYTETYYFP